MRFVLDVLTPVREDRLKRGSRRSVSIAPPQAGPVPIAPGERFKSDLATRWYKFYFYDTVSLLRMSSTACVCSLNKFCL